jgi:hypothetical protein
MAIYRTVKNGFRQRSLCTGFYFGKYALIDGASVPRKLHSRPASQSCSL